MTKQDNHIVLKAKNLSIGYKSRKKEIVITSNISFELQKGQIIGLIGANGIGKSTLLRTLTKVQPTLDGEILLNGNAIKNISSIELAKQLSIVLTEPLLSKNLSVFEIIALARHPYTNWIGTFSKKDTDIINQAIELVNIDDLKTKKCYELSDGQLQKVMIARALAQDTDLIILDEPTTHLDMYHKAYILKLLQKLTKQTGKTILFSSHEIELAIQLSDSILIMKEGNIIQDTPDNLIESGVLNEIFPNDLIIFDKDLRTFKIK